MYRGFSFAGSQVLLFLFSSLKNVYIALSVVSRVQIIAILFFLRLHYTTTKPLNRAKKAENKKTVASGGKKFVRNMFICVHVYCKSLFVQKE